MKATFDGNFMGVSYIHTCIYIYIIMGISAKSNGQFLDSSNACHRSVHVACYIVNYP